MHPGLWTLHRLRTRGFVRRSFRGIKSVRGALLFTFILIMLGFFLVPSLVLAAVGEPIDPELTRSVAPLALLMICVMTLVGTSADKAVNFNMAEVEFLFPAPFTRRELLLYKISSSAATTVFSALIFSSVFLRWATLWLGCFLGIYLTLMFVQLLAMALALVAQWIGEQLYSRFRRFALVAIAVGVGFTVWQIAPTIDTFSIVDASAQFRSVPLGAALVLPFEPFGRTIAAETVLEVIAWGSGAALMTALMLLAVLRLDANYLEAASVASERRYDLTRRAKQGQLPAMAAKHTARWRLPAPRWIGGVGPIAWQQSLQVMRSSPRVLLMLLFLSVFALPGFLSVHQTDADLTGPVIGVVVWLTLIVTSTVPCGFRADLDHMDWLKTLPVRSLPIVLGEILPGVLFVSLLQTFVLAGFAIFRPHAASTLVAAMGFTIPINLLFITAENLLFLWYPVRRAPTSPGDLQFMGRQTLMTMARMMIVGLAAGIAAIPVLIVWAIGIEQWPVLASIAWLVLIAEGLALSIAVMAAFRAFDPSVDMPG